MKMLIADDNRQIVSILTEYGKKEGFETVPAYDGKQALELALTGNFDMILLDVSMPVMDGFEVCRQIRRSLSVPVIMITARGEDFEKIMGLDIGADDYIIKPFSPGEVMARVRAILRRIEKSTVSDGQVWNRQGLYLSLDDYTVRINGKEVGLTKKEMELLWTLAVNSNKVFSRENLLNSVWGYDYFGDLRTVDTHIKRLRAKLDRFEHSGFELRTIWGVGYKLEIMQGDGV
ncbi:MAG TPA: response regulator transcription factor [Lachnospiraceae bacterium]|nr:response regulator transcription factor [Lachnospiraceae bacterium]